MTFYVMHAKDNEKCKKGKFLIMIIDFKHVSFISFKGFMGNQSVQE